MIYQISYLENFQKKKSFLSFLNKSKENEIIKECEDFKKTYKDSLDKIFVCSKCMCVKCIRECGFNPCLSCNKTGKVNYCDKENTNLIVFKNFIKQQYNNETNEVNLLKFFVKWKCQIWTSVLE